MSSIDRAGGQRSLPLEGTDAAQAAPEVAPAPAQTETAPEPAAPNAQRGIGVSRGSTGLQTSVLLSRLAQGGLGASSKGHTLTIGGARSEERTAALSLRSRTAVDPDAPRALLAQGKYPQSALLDEARGVAAHLDQVSGGALSRAAKTTSTSAHAEAGARGAFARSAEGALGRVDVSGTGFAGARADSAGQARLGMDGLTATGRASASAGFEGTIDGSFRSAMLQARGRVHGEARAYAEAEGRVKADLRGVSAQGRAEVGAAARVTIDGEFRTAGATIGGERVDLNGKVHGYAEAGAYARANVDAAATIRPPRCVVVAGAQAFAGAKAGVTGTLGLGEFVKVTGTAEAWAGAGAEAGVMAGYDDGKLKLGFNLGAAVEVGAGCSFAVEIDVNSIAKAATFGLIDLDVLLDTGDGELAKLATIQLQIPPGGQWEPTPQDLAAIERRLTDGLAKLREAQRERDARARAEQAQKRAGGS
jgi:hypothetical protein